MRYVNLAGTSVPAIGQGTWYMGEDPGRKAAEVAALQQGIELGLNLIDTAEMYAEGGQKRSLAKPLPGAATGYFWSARSTRTMPACAAWRLPANAA